MSKWIKIVIRELTEEERENYGPEVTHGYDCTLPEDGQEVLITNYRGEVAATTFYRDCDTAYFEYYEDEGEVTAWMPFPEPYKED